MYIYAFKYTTENDESLQAAALFTSPEALSVPWLVSRGVYSSAPRSRTTSTSSLLSSNQFDAGGEGQSSNALFDALSSCARLSNKIYKTCNKRSTFNYGCECLYRQRKARKVIRIFFHVVITILIHGLILFQIQAGVRRRLQPSCSPLPGLLRCALFAPSAFA